MENPRDPSSNILQTSTKFSGEWLEFKTVSLKTSSKTISDYEFIERAAKKKHHPSQDGVSIIPIVVFRSLNKRKLIIEANFRPPVNSFVLEFPGGLVETDAGTEDALRELREETGYIGTRILEKTFDYPLVYFDPWKSSENARVIIIEVDGEDPRNQSPKQALDEAEDIQVFLVDFDRDLLKRLEELRQKHDFKMSCELYSFALGMALSNLLGSNP